MIKLVISIPVKNMILAVESANKNYFFSSFFVLAANMRSEEQNQGRAFLSAPKGSLYFVRNGAYLFTTQQKESHFLRHSVLGFLQNLTKPQASFWSFHLWEQPVDFSHGYNYRMAGKSEFMLKVTLFLHSCLRQREWRCCNNFCDWKISALW